MDEFYEWMYRKSSYHLSFRPQLPCVSGVTRVGADIIVPCHMEINVDYQEGI